jgi:RHS repeat-associated protein
MLAAKHFDPIMGIDVHIVQAPGPVPPAPIPHPYIGMVLDVMDYIPKIGATVYINGLPRGQGGTSGQAIPPHIPMGGVFVKPPTNESELFLGSATVAVDDEPLVYGMLPVLTCQDIGMPAMPRKKKKSVAKSLMLPVGIVIPIPAGPLVMVGGPPSFLAALKSLAQQLALSGALKGLKKLASKSKRLQRAVKRASDAAHRLAAKLLDKVGLGKLGRLGDKARNLVHAKICSLTGHPVDVATGKVLTTQMDFELPGPIPLLWERVWFSTSAWQGPLGRGWHHAFDAALLPVQDQVVCIRTSDGRELDFLALQHGEEAFDRKEKVTLFRDGLGYALRLADGHVHRFGEVGPPGEPQRLVSIEDASGNRIRFSYDRAGRLERISDAGGRDLTVQSDAAGRIVAIFAPHPTNETETFAIVRYGYDAAGNLVEARDALGQARRFEYRGHLLSRETDRNGLSFYFQYDRDDVRAKCLRTWGDDGIYDHKLSYRLGETVVEDSLGHKTTYFHKRGTVYKTVDALGVVTLTERNQFGELVKEVDGLGHPTTYDHDDRGNVDKTMGPDGATTTITYDARNRPIETVDAVEGVWSWKYDREGRLAERIDPLGRTLRYQWSEGRLAAFIDPAGHTTSFRYDRARNLVGMRTPDRAQSGWEFDRLGRCIRAVNPLGGIQTRAYDMAGRVTRVEDPDGNVRSLAYDGESNVVHAKDVHHDVHFTYAGMGRLASRTEAGTTVRFEYDTEEQLTAVTNEHGRVYRFLRGPTGEVDEESGFDGSLRKYTRNAAALVVRIDRPGGRFSEYKYDAGGRVVAVAHSDGSTETYGHRSDGALMVAANGSAAVVFERDVLGRIVKETQGSHWVESQYDGVGLRARMRSSFGAEHIIQRNAMGDVIGVAEAKSRFEAHIVRDQLGLELERSLPGGLQSRWERDRMGRPTQHTVGTSRSILRSVGYQWEPNDRLRKIIDAFRGPIDYTHDALGNLASIHYADGTIDLRMPDAVGNLFRRDDRSDREYGPAGQLLSQTDERGVTHYVYDPEGNLVEKREPNGRTWRYAWNAAGTLAKVTRPDGNEVTFAYDALGRRVTKTFRGQTTHWVWDGNNPLHEWVEGHVEAVPRDAVPFVGSDDAIAKKRDAELEALLAQGPPDRGTKQAPITWLFEPESFAPMAKLVGDEQLSIVTDHLGAPVLMADGYGRTRWKASFTAYGALRALDGERNACPFRWPGQYEDAETGLYYNRFRYYDPESGRYTSQDPIGLTGGRALYGYVHDPATSIDPLGLAACRPTSWADELPDPFAGTKQASAHLKSLGVPRPRRKEIIESFERGTIRLEAAGPNLHGTRFHGGAAKPMGQYLFETFTPQTNRANLALPPKWNDMTGLRQYEVKPGTTLIRGKAAPQSAQGSQYVGGADQMYVHEPWRTGSLR